MSAIVKSTAIWRRSLKLAADEFARCLGYDYCCIMTELDASYFDWYVNFMSRKCTGRFIIALGYMDKLEYGFMFDEDGAFFCTDYEDINYVAKLIYKTLNAGKKLNIMDKQLVGAEDVAKFMMDCVMTGLAQECE